MKNKLVNIRRWIMFYIVWPLAFKIGSLRPMDKKLILFAFNKNYGNMPDNLKCLYEYYKEKGYNCKIMQSPQSSVKRILFYISFQFDYARCKCVFVTDNFEPLYSCRPNDGTRVIQLWHACGAFKKWGFSTLDLKWGGSREDMLRFPLHNTYTDVFVSSEYVIPFYAEAFGCSEKIIKALGTPRTDIYFDGNFVSNCRDRLIEKFPQIGKRKILLYAPTFRGDSPEQSYNEDVLDYAMLKENFGEEYALVLKLHPFTAKKFKLSDKSKADCGDFIFDASDLPIEVNLCAADVLIADYSSLIFEYALLNKPMLFYAYDLEQYDHDRSFYHDYESFIPGKLVKTNEELVTALRRKDFEANRIADFREKFMSACDGHCVEKIAEYCIKE